MTRAMLDRYFQLIDQFSFEWDGVAEDNPDDPIVKEIRDKAQWIYDQIDKMRIEKMEEQDATKRGS